MTEQTFKVGDEVLFLGRVDEYKRVVIGVNGSELRIRHTGKAAGEFTAYARDYTLLYRPSPPADEGKGWVQRDDIVGGIFLPAGSKCVLTGVSTEATLLNDGRTYCGGGEAFIQAEGDQALRVLDGYERTFENRCYVTRIWVAPEQAKAEMPHPDGCQCRECRPKVEPGPQPTTRAEQVKADPYRGQYSEDFITVMQQKADEEEGKRARLIRHLRAELGTSTSDRRRAMLYGEVNPITNRPTGRMG